MAESRKKLPLLGLIVTGKLTCDGCGKVMRHPERYAYLYRESPPLRLCEGCSRARGLLTPEEDERLWEETFL